MSNLKDFADNLQHEVVSDMAENYFGDRKNLEDMMNAFQLLVQEFRLNEPVLAEAAARLHYLLLDQQTARNFYIALDIVPSCIPFSDDVMHPHMESIPFSFTMLGRYERCVCSAYEKFQQVADEYVNGRYFDDPDQPGRKRLTVHYLRLRALAEYINDEVKRINENVSATGALRFVKRMDPEQSEREDMIGAACLIDGCGLDEAMKFTPIDFEALELAVVQDLPRLSKVKSVIRQFCKEIYPSRKDDIKRVVESMRDG